MSQLAITGGTPFMDPQMNQWVHPKISPQVSSRLQEAKFLDQMASYDGSGVFEELESKYARIFDLKYTLSTNSGTSALLSLFYAHGLSTGDEVIVPAYTFYATVSPLYALGCKILFADCLSNGNIDPDEVKRLISSKTKAIVITHMWGIPCDMDILLEIAQNAGVVLLEDASHAHGAKYNEKHIGSFADGAAWSLGAKKPLTGGQGGILAVAGREEYERALLLGHSNNRAKKEIRLPEHLPFRLTGRGYNLRMHPFSAALLIDQLQRFDEMQNEKNRVAEKLVDMVNKNDGLDNLNCPDNASPSWFMFIFKYTSQLSSLVPRELIVEALHKEGAIDEVVDSGIKVESKTGDKVDIPLFYDDQFNKGSTFERWSIMADTLLRNGME